MSVVPGTLVASGDNFTIHVADGVVRLRVWSRRDMSYARGAELAQKKVDVLREVARRAGVVGLLFDLTEAAPVVGPVTEDAVQAMMRAFADHGHRVAVVVGPSPTQGLQFTRLAREACKRRAPWIVSDDIEDAERFLRPAP